ncbi:topoisomerase C-terminal repeat-containing protein [Metabacillus fastidiosus]|uniref:topoisomerase C-terminal repeat-containing protein n=1 Tax=Metabacillus fastidiosus TaxID=1458 RepID=UPI003D2E377C
MRKEFPGKNSSVSNVKKLLDTKKSNLIKGFKSKKNGNKFDAFLILNSENELKMEFPQATKAK